MKNKFLFPLALTLTVGCTNAKIDSEDAPSANNSELSATESAAVHGMVVFGSETLFVSHIPMFMSPHDRQALMQVSLTHAQSDALAVYQRAALSASGTQTLITIRPKPFVLSNLLSGRISSFQADLYKGNFEDGGRLLLSNVTVSVDSVLYSTQLSKTSKAAEKLTYIPVETQDGSYLVHQITAPKNFDHIVQIQWINDTVPLKNSLRSFPLSDKEVNRLQVGQYFTVNDDGTMSESDSVADASFKVVAGFYCTQGPDFYNLCD